MLGLARGLGYQAVNVKCYDILDTRMANAMITPIYNTSVYMITIKGNAANSQGGSLSRTLCGLDCATMSLFGKPCRLSLQCFGRTVAQGPSGSVRQHGWDRVVRGGRMLSSMLIISISIHLYAHKAERGRGRNLPKGKMKPMQNSRIWRF